MSSVKSVKGFLWLLLALLLMNFCSRAHSSSCSIGYIRCKSSSKCILYSSICDGYNECNDTSDEAFCTEYRNTGCSTRGKARCTSNGGSAYITIPSYCMTVNPPCVGILDLRICEMFRGERLQDINNIVITTTEAPTTTTTSTTTTTTTTPQPTTTLPTNLQETKIRGQMFADTISNTLSHPECPNLYTRVANSCLSLFYIAKVGWGEAKEFCETMSGELVSFQSHTTDFNFAMKHMRESGLKADFWIGGRYVNDTEGWRWLNGDAMEMGSPFWAVRYANTCLEREETGDSAIAYLSNRTACYHYQQAPRSNTTDFCAALTFRHYHYITDENCLGFKSPLCIYTKNSTSVQLEQ